MAIVYALALASSPADFRYIGRTAKSPNIRLGNHISTSKSRDTYMYRWMRKALDGGDSVEIVVIEDGLTWEDSGIREIYWISLYRKAGFRLTNTSNGGDGNKGYVKTPEHLAKIGLASKGRVCSPETRAKISKAKLGKKQTPEHTANLVVAITGKKHKFSYVRTPEHTAKIAAANQGIMHSPEVRQRMREAQIKRRAREAGAS